MRILQSGMPKSGNFWLWQILQESIKAADLPNGSFIQAQPIYPIAKNWKLSFKEQADIDVMDIAPYNQAYRISTIFRMPIADLDAYLSQTNHVWTHSNFNAGSNRVFPKFDKIVYILRDPRDMILSQSRFAFTEYRQKYLRSAHNNPESFLKGRIPALSERWRSHVGVHLQNRHDYNIHMIFYERLLHDFDAEYSKLLAYLGIELPSASIAEIKTKVQFETMQVTNPNHLSKGQSYKWMEQLSAEQNAKVTAICGDLLSQLGYPLSATDSANLPSLDGVTDDKLMLIMNTKKKKPFMKRAIRRVTKLLMGRG